jgi:tRNA(Arg) A34 adenosine deaminase TadA
VVHSSLSVTIDLPSWVRDFVDWERSYGDDEERMRLAVELSRENVLRGTGGPFGAAVFEAETGRLAGVGVNSVVRLSNSVLHAETVALMLAEGRAGSYTLGAPGLPPHELVTSCEPCAMCLGAVFWSGVRRVMIGAAREDAEALGFDEGPVFPDSYRYLEERGIAFQRDVLRDEAREVLKLYHGQEGAIYQA